MHTKFWQKIWRDCLRKLGADGGEKNITTDVKQIDYENVNRILQAQGMVHSTREHNNVLTIQVLTGGGIGEQPGKSLHSMHSVTTHTINVSLYYI